MDRYGQLSGAQPQAQTNDNLLMAINSFGDIQEALYRLLSRVGQAADAISGPVPQEANIETTPPTPPNSHLNNLHRRRQDMSAAIARIERELSRLEAGVIG